MPLLVGVASGCCCLPNPADSYKSASADACKGTYHTELSPPCPAACGGGGGGAGGTSALLESAGSAGDPGSSSSASSSAASLSAHDAALLATLKKYEFVTPEINDNELTFRFENTFHAVPLRSRPSVLAGSASHTVIDVTAGTSTTTPLGSCQVMDGLLPFGDDSLLRKALVSTCDDVAPGMLQATLQVARAPQEVTDAAAPFRKVLIMPLENGQHVAFDEADAESLDASRLRGKEVDLSYRVDSEVFPVSSLSQSNINKILSSASNSNQGRGIDRSNDLVQGLQHGGSSYLQQGASQRREARRRRAAAAKAKAQAKAQATAKTTAKASPTGDKYLKVRFVCSSGGESEAEGKG